MCTNRIDFKLLIMSTISVDSKLSIKTKGYKNNPLELPCDDLLLPIRSIIKHSIVNLENNSPKSVALFGMIRNSENTSIVTIL
jgi:hypothetical protein